MCTDNQDITINEDLCEVEYALRQISSWLREVAFCEPGVKRKTLLAETCIAHDYFNMLSLRCFVWPFEIRADVPCALDLYSEDLFLCAHGCRVSWLLGDK